MKNFLKFEEVPQFLRHNCHIIWRLCDYHAHNIIDLSWHPAWSQYVCITDNFYAGDDTSFNDYYVMWAVDMENNKYLDLRGLSL